MAELTKKEQYVRVAYLGVSFMIMFTSFNSLQNMVSKLYEEYHYYNLGQTAIIAIYMTFGVCTIFTSYFIKVFGFKMVMFVSSLGYAIFQATGLLIASDLNLEPGYIWTVVIIGAMICGASASAIWVAQGAYTSQVASANRKSELFGLFWGLMMSSQIFGNLLSTFVLGKLSNFVYFIMLTVLGFLSALMFLFLPNVSKNEQQVDRKQFSIKQEAGKVWTIIKNPKYVYLNLYFIFPGLSVAFYAGFLYKLIKLSVSQNQGQSIDDYNQRLSQSSGLVFISLGASQLITGLMMNLFSQRFCKFKLAVIGTLIVELAGFTSFITYFVKSYPLCFVCAFLWGCSQNFLQTNTGGLIAKLFPNNIEAFSVYRIFFALGVSAILFLTIAMSNLPDYIFLTVILVLQCLATGISFNLRDLNTDEDRKSLMSENQNS